MNPLQEQKYFISDLKELPILSTYKNEKNETQSFKKIYKHLKIRLEILLHHVSPYFVYDETIPSLVKCKSQFEKIRIEIFNFTKENVVINNKNIICVNDQNTHLCRKSCSLLVYHTFFFPHIICIEEQDHNQQEASQRSFIVKTNNTYRYYKAKQLPWKVNHHSLFAQIPTGMKDYKTFYSTTPILKHMVQNPMKDAILKKSPQLLQYKPRKNLNWFSIVNHTKQPITIDIEGNLLIDYKPITKYIYIYNHNNYIIVHELKSKLGVICVEQRDDSTRYNSKRLFCNPVWGKMDTFKHTKVFTDIHKTWMFKTLWTGLYEKKSFFYKRKIPKEIIGEIMVKYINLLNLKL
jgi:hypothetical protein